MSVAQSTATTWPEEVRRLARARDAVVLAHNYQDPAIQDVADHVGDSLELSRIAASTDASTIVFCGVHFMAETAKLLSPNKTVLIPTAQAGCSLADTIDADQLRSWKAEHPGAAVVAYVNTSAAVKAEADVCCTSSNAVDVVESIPADQPILFLPDQFLGNHVRRQTGRDNIHVWMGECHVHAGISAARSACSGGGRSRRRRFWCIRSAAARPRRSGSPASVICPRTGPGFCPPPGCSAPLAT